MFKPFIMLIVMQMTVRIKKQNMECFRVFSVFVIIASGSVCFSIFIISPVLVNLHH